MSARKKEAAPQVKVASAAIAPRDLILFLSLAVAGIAVGAVAWYFIDRDERPIVARPRSDSQEKEEAKAESEKPRAGTSSLAADPADYQQIVGRWMRDDGGYILEIKSVDKDGKLEAAYLNPQPIKVYQARASQQGSTLRVFVELRDVNYPGSTYTLFYDPNSDRLIGDYYQATQQQVFDVRFDRVRQ